MKGNTDSPAPTAALPNLKALNPYRSTSPPKKTPAKTHQEFARGSYREESVNDFVDLHRTFYTSLTKKIKIDTQTKKTNSIFKDSTLHASRRAVSVNTGIADQNSDATFIKRNIQKVIEKPPVKQFKYLQEDERIRRAIEPKRLIRGLDDLYSRIDRIFVKQSDDEDFSPRQQIREYQKSVVQGNPDRSPSKTPEPKLFVKQKDVKVLVKKKSQSNLTKDDKPEAVANGIAKERVLVKTKADNLEISFEGAWKKENKGKLPQIRSSSQPRASTTTRAAKSSLISPIAVPTENPEAEVANKSISGPASEKFDYKFQKMMTYAEKGGLEPLGSEENRTSLKDLFQTQSAEKIEKVEKEPPKENKSKSPAPTKKGKKPVDDTPLDHNLPARPVIKSLKDETFIMENYTLNKNMSVMLGNTLGQKTELKVLALVNNKLTDETISALLEPVMADPKDIEVFRCVKNTIGEKFISIFEKKFFSLGKNCLKELTLDGCIISEKDLDAVLYVLNGARPRLKHLGLAKVGLNEQAIRTLCRLIVNSEFLTSLDLGWNNMNKECIRILLEGIKVNQSIRYLDLSWSSLAHADNKNAKTLKEIIVKSNQLVHLNLSHTDLSDSDVTLVIEGVRRSRNVVAVHLGGNHMTALMIERINEFLGAKKSVYENILSPFNESLENKVYSNVQSGCTYSCKGPESDKLKKTGHDQGKSPKKENNKDLDEVDENNPLSYKESEHLIYSRILDNDVTHDGDVWVQSKNCWVCERWKKIQISYKIPKPKQKEKEVQEHNSQRSEKPRSTRVQRMSQDFIDDVEIDVPKGEREDVKIVGSFTKNQHVKMVYDNQARSYEYSVYMPPGNHQYKIDWLRHGAGADQVLLEGKIAVLPRESKIHPMQDPLKKNSLIVGNEEFVKERSVFADFRHDEDSVLRKAFETDIRKFTMYDFLKKRNELDKILIFLYKNFEIIKSVFIHYAAISLYPYINFEKMLELLEECEAFDFDFKRSDVTKTCIVTRDSDETTQAPQDGLNRHNFIEVLVKVAPIKYNPKRAPEIQAELIERFFEEFIFKKGKKTLQHYHDFRVKKIYTGAIDKLLKANIDGLEEIFKKKRQLFGIKIESLKEIAQASKIDINDKDLNLLAAYSKMTIIDEEKDSKKYGLLVFVEFLEFLVRLAEHTVKERELIEKLGVTLEKILKSHEQNFHKNLSEI